METSNQFYECRNAVDLLRRYKQLAMLNHPAKGGSFEKMEQVYKDYLEALKAAPFQVSRMKESLQKDLKSFPGLIKEILALNLEMEMCGSWLWISGKTFECRDKLKDLGLRYSPNKRMWYFRPGGEESHASKPMDMAWIRGKYGSDIIVAESHINAEVMS